MFKNISKFMKRKYICVDLFNGDLKAFEKDENISIDKSIEEIYPDVLNIKNNKSYWYDFNTMKQLSTYVLKSTKKSFLRPILYIAYPFEFSELDKQNIVDAITRPNWIRACIIDNFLCSANGTSIGGEEPKRKIYVYSLNNITYIGLIFAGSGYNVNILEKGYNELTEIDIKSSVDKLLNEVSMQPIPENFKKYELSEKILEEINRGWELEIERKIYLSVPSELKNRFNINIGTYQLVYLEYKDVIIEGLKKILDKI